MKLLFSRKQTSMAECKNQNLQLLMNLFLSFRCPQRNVLSSFNYLVDDGMAEATLFSMFRFPESSTVHHQCDVFLCKVRRPSSTFSLCCFRWYHYNHNYQLSINNSVMTADEILKSDQLQRSIHHQFLLIQPKAENVLKKLKVLSKRII